MSDGLFSIQVSQGLIIHKDSRVPDKAAFTYQGKPVAIRTENMEIKNLDWKNPRFLIAFGTIIIKQDSARLSFIMPDVGLGIDTHWK